MPRGHELTSVQVGLIGQHRGVHAVHGDCRSIPTSPIDVTFRFYVALVRNCATLYVGSASPYVRIQRVD